MQSEKNKYCCEEHIDRAFDDFLVENETYPSMNEVIGKKCSYCYNAATYELSDNK